MALTFGAATTDQVDFGSLAILDNVLPFTFVAWVYPTTFTNLRKFWHKGGNGTGKWIRLSGTAGAIETTVNRSTSAAQYITNNLPLVLNTWNFLCVSSDIAAGAGQIINIYRGDLTTLAVEATYGTATDGSGTGSTDAAGNYIIGNSAAGASAVFQGRIAFISHFNRVLTLGEIKQQQFRPYKASGCVLLNHLGYKGVGAQPDWSGNFNSGTVTGATVSAHVPLQLHGAISYSPYVIGGAPPAGWGPLLGLGNNRLVVTA